MKTGQQPIQLNPINFASIQINPNQFDLGLIHVANLVQINSNESEVEMIRINSD